MQPVLPACHENQDSLGSNSFVGDFKFGFPIDDSKNAKLFLEPKPSDSFSEIVLPRVKEKKRDVSSGLTLCLILSCAAERVPDHFSGAGIDA